MDTDKMKSPLTTRQNDEPLWDLGDCAQYLRRSTKTVRRWAKAGTIPSRRIGTQIQFVPEEVRQWVLNQPDASAA